MHVGGQAVIEGVMMRAKDTWSVAVRDQKGTIHVRRNQIASLPRMLKLPLIRGVVTLFQAITIGVKAIDFSASKAYSEEEKTINPLLMSVTITFAFLLGIGLFIFLPLYLTKLLGVIVPSVAANSFLFNLVDGFLRVVIFLAYVILLSLWKEMRRIFEYHGAEHKVIYAYEAGINLKLDSIKQFSTHHPRCGTSFLFIVMLLSIVIFSFIPKSWDFVLKFGSRIFLIPFIAGISYEMLRLSSRMKDNPVIHMMIQPGLLLQHITTKEPDESQMEVALRALMEVVSPEKND